MAMMMSQGTPEEHAAKHLAARILWKRDDVEIDRNRRVLVGGKLSERHHEAIVLVALFIRIQETQGDEALADFLEKARAGFGKVVVDRALLLLSEQGSVSAEFVALTASYAAGEYDATNQSGVSRHG